MLVQTLATALVLAQAVLAARPFLNEPDTGFEGYLSWNLSASVVIQQSPAQQAEGANAPDGQAAAPPAACAPAACAPACGAPTAGRRPDLSSIVSLPDFDAAARSALPLENYTYYRNGAAGEWSYRNNLEVFRRFSLRPRVLNDISNVENTLSTTILGYNFSAPFYISACARGELAHPEAESNFVKAAAAQNLLYMPALFASKTIEQIAADKAQDQVVFQQLYLTGNETADDELIKRTEDSGAKAIVFTIDSAADGNRHRAARFGVGSADSDYSNFTARLHAYGRVALTSDSSSLQWAFFAKLKARTTLPIILKGIMTVEDAKLAVCHNASAIVLSNHGGRQLDGAPSALEVALEIRQEASYIFDSIEVFADGGVRYGVDILMLLSLGVKAVGIGRPFMYANMYGQEGVDKAINLMKHEMALDAGNLGVADIAKIRGQRIVNWTPNKWMG
ncbi:hypothetical protein CDD83_648 [Cordyceps sp. RAO-2017]|nr:hypothetical protein CDD83_648 [Cordyceps sp. RAO-2017]